jgi:hypothetical protein
MQCVIVNARPPTMGYAPLTLRGEFFALEPRPGAVQRDYRLPESSSDAWESVPRSLHSQPSEQIGDPSEVHSWSATG